MTAFLYLKSLDQLLVSNNHAYHMNILSLKRLVNGFTDLIKNGVEFDFHTMLNPEKDQPNTFQNWRMLT
jgi:hypothetical protein